MITISYGFIFKDFQAEVLDAYNRYMYTYYIAWFVIAAAVLAWVVQTGRWRLLGQAGALAFACLMLLRVNMMVLPQMSVLGFSERHLCGPVPDHGKGGRGEGPDRRGRPHLLCEPGRRRPAPGSPTAATSSPIFWITAAGNWTRRPDCTARAGGTFCLPENMPEVKEGGALYFHAYSTEDFAKAVAESGCEYIFVEKLDAGFVAAYGSLFTDGLAAAENGETLLYRITPDGYEPVAMEVPR